MKRTLCLLIVASVVGCGGEVAAPPDLPGPRPRKTTQKDHRQEFLRRAISEMIFDKAFVTWVDQNSLQIGKNFWVFLPREREAMCRMCFEYCQTEKPSLTALPVMEDGRLIGQLTAEGLVLYEDKSRPLEVLPVK